MNCSLGAMTHTGLVRSRNEDYLRVALSADLNPGIDALLVVADGMGGHEAGDMASKRAADRIVELFSDVSPADNSGGLADQLQKAFQSANEHVRQTAVDLGLDRIGTTLTVMLISGRRGVLAHVGDSRAYLLRSGQLKQLTVDHSLVNERVAAGLLTHAQAVLYPHRNVITRAVGSNVTLIADISEVTLSSGDRILLCSDGIHNLISYKQIKQILVTGSAQTISENLIATANSRGGRDNCTAVVAILDFDQSNSGSAGLRRPD